MTWLLLDVGNTSTTFAITKAVIGKPGAPIAEFLQRGHVRSHPLSSLGQRIQKQLTSPITQVVVGSVVRGASDALKKAFAPIPVHRILSQEIRGFENTTLAPEQVGVDRLINVKAALKETKPPFLILDTGTATTLCAVDEKSHYRGGAILPGLSMVRDALHEKTSLLPSIELRAPEHAIGRNTEEALLSGIVLATAKAVQGLVLQFRSELNLSASAPLPLFGTGGKIDLIAPFIPEITHVDRDLTLKGAFLIATELTSL